MFRRSVYAVIQEFRKDYESVSIFEESSRESLAVRVLEKVSRGIFPGMHQPETRNAVRAPAGPWKLRVQPVQRDLRFCAIVRSPS